MNWSVERDGAIAYVSYDNPPENRLPFRAVREFDERLQEVAQDDAVKVVAIRSKVAGFFSAGGDLADIRQLIAGGSPSAPFDSWIFALLRLEEMPQPTVALIDGLAASGGFELSLACTFRLGTPSAEFALREVSAGALPGGGATQRLPRILNIPLASEIILTGRTIGAEEAARIGLLQALLPDTAGFTEWLERLTKMPRASLIAAKRAIVDGSRVPLMEGLRLEQRLFHDIVRQR
jgi:enoyl-CoA hydratase/carnithine racemase